MAKGYILIVLLFIISMMMYVSSKLLKKEFSKKTDENLGLLIDELKNIDQIKFNVVPSEIMYSKTFAVVLRAYSYVLFVWFWFLALDVFTAKTLFVFDDTLTPFFITGILFLMINVIFILPLGCLTWKYTYFKYGITNELKNLYILHDLINPIKTKLLKNYIIVSSLFYLIGRVLFGAGVFSVEAGSVFYAIYIYIYFHLEVERIGFAPIFNLCTEKLNELKGK